MPRDHRRRFDDDERLFPPAPDPRKHDPDDSVYQLRPRPRIRFVGCQCQLLAKREILQGKIGARPDEGRDQRFGRRL